MVKLIGKSKFQSAGINANKKSPCRKYSTGADIALITNL